MKYLLLFLVAILSSCASTNTKDLEPSVFGDDHPLSGMPSEPGKCYAKCELIDIYETTTEKIIEFTGDTTIEKVEIMKLLKSRKYARWHKGLLEDCVPSDTNDCVTWNLVDVPAQYILVLKDTTQSSNWRTTKVEYQKLVQEKGYTEWSEVVCNGDVTPQLYSNVIKGLCKSGFYKGDPKDDYSWDNEAKVALTSFQKYKGLPIGSLNILTMEALGVQY